MRKKKFRCEKKAKKMPFFTFKSLQGGHVDLADAPVMFFYACGRPVGPVGHMPFSVTGQKLWKKR
jgi:hypothetical protein